MTDYSEDQLVKAPDTFLQLVDVTRFQPYGFSLYNVYNEHINLSIDIYWHNSSGNLEIFFDPSGKPEERCILTLSQLNEISEDFDKEIRKACTEHTHISSLLVWVIAKLGEYQSAPNDIEIEFIFDQHVGDNRIVMTLDELLESLENQQGSSIAIIFNSRWELIVDLFDELQANGLSCEIAAPNPDESDYLQELEAEQCVDLGNDHELYLYVKGMCSVVEVIWLSVQAGTTSNNELKSVLNVVCNNLSIIRPFLPDAYFTRFFA